MSVAKTALQLWTVRELAMQDYAGTLSEVVKIGYSAVEQVHAFGYGGRSAGEVKNLMSDLGLETAAAHVELKEWEADAQRILDFYDELGVRYLVVSWLEPERRESKDAYLNVIESLKPIAAACKQRGKQLVYHHHDFEFEQYDGRTALDLLCRSVGEEKLLIEADVHWVYRGGADPAEFIKALGKRCPLVHLKDFHPAGLGITDHGDVRAYTELGTGSLNIPSIIEAAEFADWLIVEQDFCKMPPLESAKLSLDYLKEITGS